MRRKACEVKLIKSLVIILSIIFVFFGANSIKVNAETSDLEKIDFLIKKGATREIVEKLSHQRLQDLYNQVIEEDVHCKSYGKTVIKEIPSDSVARGAIEPSELTLSCWADFYVRSDNTISWAVVEYEGKWEEGKPYILGEDVVTFNWDSDKFVCDFAEFYSEYYPYDDVNSAHTAYYIDTPAQAALQGVGYYVDLQRFDYESFPDTALIKNRGFYGILDLVPNDTVLANESTYFGTTLNYAHNKNPLPISISFSVVGVNIAINPGVLVDTIGENFAFRLE